MIMKKAEKRRFKAHLFSAVPNSLLIESLQLTSTDEHACEWQWIASQEYILMSQENFATQSSGSERNVIKKNLNSLMWATRLWENSVDSFLSLVDSLHHRFFGWVWWKIHILMAYLLISPHPRFSLEWQESIAQRQKRFVPWGSTLEGGPEQGEVKKMFN